MGPGSLDESCFGDITLAFALTLLELERGGIDTVAKSCWLGAIVEDVTKVCVTPATADFGPNHAVARVSGCVNAVFVDWLVEAGPS